MLHFDTTTNFINNRTTTSAPSVNDIVKTYGYSTAGGVGGARWKATGNVIAVSQDPLTLNDIKLSDASGNEYELVLEEAGIIDLNVLGGTSAGYENIATSAGLTFSQGLTSDVSNDLVNVDTAANLIARSGVSVGEAFVVADRANGIFDAKTGLTANGFDILQSSTDGSIQYELRIKKEIYLPSLGTVNDSTGPGTGTDNAPAYQRAIELQKNLGLSIREGSGRFRIATPLTYTTSDLDIDTANGFVFSGEGMGKTIIQNDVVGTMLFIENDTGTTFAKGNSLKRFTIIGKGVSGSPDQVALRHQAAWYNKYENVKISKVNGTAVQSGDSDSIDPDATASVQFSFDTCEFDENVIGFNNPQNNNSPVVIFLNSSVRNNSRGGIRGNSSYIQLKNCSLSFNGITDSSNAFGGLDIMQQAGSSFSDGYRSKGVIIDSTELDTNYPFNARFLQAENPVIRNCSTQFRDYPGIDWAGNGITEFPDAQFVFGGSGVNERCFEGSIKDCRVSIVANGNLPVNPTGHSIVQIGINGIGTNFAKINYNLDFTGSGSSLGDKFHIITENQKTGSFDNRKYYVEYDYPKSNLSTSDILNGFNQCFHKKIFPSFAAQTGDGMHFAFLLNDDTVKQIPLPQLTSDSPAGANYNHFAITINGTINAIYALRCAGSPASTILTNGPGILDTGTGTPTGTTGTDGNITVFADTDGTCWVENRGGSAFNFQCSFLLAPGLAEQL